MDIQEASKVMDEFRKYIDTGNDSVIKTYSIKYIKSIILHISDADKKSLPYKEMERYVQDRKDDDKEKRGKKFTLVITIITLIGTALCTYLFGPKRPVVIMSNNPQYFDITVQNMFYNEKGQLVTNATAQDRATGETVKLQYVSKDVGVAEK